MVDNAFSLVGRQVGRIRITAEAGHGAMSSVYVGFDDKLQRQVAVKAIARRFRIDPEARANFLGEARILSSLDHPGVCQIYDYLEADDYDLLVMELVDGRRLTDAMNEELSLAVQIDIAGQILDVLSAVHESGIVHRDLKPDNVMVTGGGVVKVLDFGIASLEATATPQERVSKAVIGSTVVGEERQQPRQTGIFGTLRSMSPEQARGEPVTPASDIYSLGLLFQELFTGHSPMESGLPPPVLLARAAAGETLPVEGIDIHLATLIERMKSVAPGARPSARDARNLLRLVVDRPRRRRRRRAVAGVWLILILLSVGLAVQSGRAGREAQKATEARADAEELVEFILEDLHETLQPLGRLDLVAEITEQALAYYDRRSEGQFEPAELARHARGLSKLREVFEGLGRLTEAETAQRRAVDIRRELVSLAPEKPSRRLMVAWELISLHRVLDYQGHRSEAQQALEEAAELAGPLVDDDEIASLARTVMSSYWDRVGTERCENGDLAGCVQAFTAAHDIDAAVFAADQDEASRWNLAVSRSRLADLHLVRGDVEAARDAYQAALELLPEVEDDLEWQELATDFRVGMASVLLAEGDAAAAVAEQRVVLSQRQEVADHDPSNLLSRYRASLTHLGLGEMLFEQGQIRSAAGVLKSVVAESREVSAADPSDVIYVQYMATALAVEGMARQHLGQHRAARGLLSEALEIQQGLYDRDPEDTASIVGLATTGLTLGEVEQAIGRRQTARELWQRALDLIGSVAADSDHPEYRLAWAQALALTGKKDEARSLLAELPLSYGRFREVRRWCSATRLPLPGR